MAKKSAIGTRVPFWFKLRSIAEPIKIKKIGEILDGLNNKDVKESNTITKVIKQEKNNEEKKPNASTNTTEEVSGNTKIVDNMPKVITDNTYLDNMPKITPDDTYSYNMPNVKLPEMYESDEANAKNFDAENYEKNAKNSEKNAKNDENLQKNEKNHENDADSSSVSLDAGNKITQNKSEQNATPKSVSEFEQLIDDILKKHEGKTDYDYYKDKIPQVKPSLELTPLDDVVINEDEIRKSVEERLTKKNAESQADLKAKTQEKIDKLVESINAEKEKSESAEAKLASTIQSAKDDISMDALKRGLQRSSIVIQQLSKLDGKLADELVDMQKSLQQSVESSTQKINALEEFLDESLANLDGDLASEIEKEILTETQNLKNKQAEVVKFNNNIKKLESDYQLKAQKQQASADEQEEKLKAEYKGIANRTKKDELVEACKKFLGGMSKADAINYLQSSKKLQDALGDRYYDVYYLVRKG